MENVLEKFPAHAPHGISVRMKDKPCTCESVLYTCIYTCTDGRQQCRHEEEALETFALAPGSHRWAQHCTGDPGQKDRAQQRHWRQPVPTHGDSRTAPVGGWPDPEMGTLEGGDQDSERAAREHRGRSDTPTSQGMLAIARGHQKPEGTSRTLL